jgi:hypothetical protein
LPFGSRSIVADVQERYVILDFERDLRHTRRVTRDVAHQFAEDELGRGEIGTVRSKFA